MAITGLRDRLRAAYALLLAGVATSRSSSLLPGGSVLGGHYSSLCPIWQRQTCTTLAGRPGTPADHAYNAALSPVQLMNIMSDLRREAERINESRREQKEKRAQAATRPDSSAAAAAGAGGGKEQLRAHVRKL